MRHALAAKVLINFALAICWTSTRILRGALFASTFAKHLSDAGAAIAERALWHAERGDR